MPRAASPLAAEAGCASVGSEEQEDAAESEETQGPNWEYGYKCVLYHGVVYLPYIKPAQLDELRAGLELQARDIVVVSFPKCGTTWCQNIVLNLLYGGRSGCVRDPMRQAPWIEASYCRGKMTLQGMNSMEGGIGPGRVRCLKSHAPAHLAPWRVARPGSRLLLVTRDPRDAAVSFYHHMRNAKAYKFDGDWDQFLSLFLAGRVEGGNFWRWHEGWARHAEAAAAEGGGESCLWVRYEDLQADLRGQVERIARFMGLLGGNSAAFGMLGEAELDAVTAASEFSSMQGMFGRLNAIMMANGKKFNPQHLRRGVVGSWPELMSEEKSEEFLELTRACTAPIWDLPFPPEYES